MKNKRNGFTLAELLIVVSIIGVLVAVSIPVFSQQLEKSREATDLANVRAKYAEVMAEAMDATASYPISKSVKLKQKQSDWQYYEPAVIAGIIHYRRDGDTDHWKGVPGAGGECVVSYNPGAKGIVFIWSGGTVGGSGTGTKINFEEDIHKKVNQTGLTDRFKTSSFEIDSKCPNSGMVKPVQESLDSNSLLKHGTWAYLGDTNATPKKLYLFWTSVDTNQVGAKTNVPIIVSKADGGFYVTTSETASRTAKTGEKYVAIADHIYNQYGFAKYTKGKEYNTLEEAYDAYAELVEKSYPDYKETLLK